MNKSDKRADIMQAALEIIAERGFHDAPMSEISEKASVFRRFFVATFCMIENFLPPLAAAPGDL